MNVLTVLNVHITISLFAAFFNFVEITILMHTNFLPTYPTSWLIDACKKETLHVHFLKTIEPFEDTVIPVSVS